MNIDTKSLNKFSNFKIAKANLANKISKPNLIIHQKDHKPLIKWDLIQGYKPGPTSANQSAWYMMLTKWRIKKSYDISIDGQKTCDKIQHPFMILKKKKPLNKAKYRGNISQHNKGCIWHSHR